MLRAARLLAVITTAIALIPAGAAHAAPATPRSTVNPALPAPTTLSATNDSGSIHLSWRQPRTGAQARSFRVYEGSTVVARHTTTNVLLRNLGFGTSHTYTVTAVDAQGRESAHSAPVTWSTWVGGQPPPCNPPMLAGFRTGEVTSSAVSLSWSWSDPFRPLLLQVGATNVPAGRTGVRVGGLAPGTSHTLRVTTTDCRGMTYPLASVTVTTLPGAVERPAPPATAEVTTVTDTSATLRWSAPTTGAPAVRYAVYEGGDRVAVTGSTAVTVRRLFHAQRYGFTVAAIDAAGNESAHTPILAVTTTTCPATRAKPIDVRADALSPSTVRLSWVQVSQAASFTVYDGSTVVATTTAPAAVLSGLASGSRHSYRVLATLLNGCGDSARSSSVTVRTPAGPSARPATPTGVYARVRTQNLNTNAVVAVSWSTPPGADPAAGYRVYEDATVVATSTTSSAEVTVLTNTTHTYRVTAVDAAGNESAASAPATVQVPYFPLP